MSDHDLDPFIPKFDVDFTNEVAPEGSVIPMQPDYDDILADAPDYVKGLKRDADIYTIQDMLLKGDPTDPEFLEYHSKTSAPFQEIESALMSLLARTTWAHLATIVNGVSLLHHFDPNDLEKEVHSIADLIKYLEGESDKLTGAKEELPIMTLLFLKHVIRLLRAYQHLIYEELVSRDEYT